MLGPVVILATYEDLQAIYLFTFVRLHDKHLQGHLNMLITVTLRCDP